MSVFSCFHLNVTEVLPCSYFIMILYALKIVEGKKGTYKQRNSVLTLIPFPFWFAIDQDSACDFQNAEFEHQRNCKTLTQHYIFMQHFLNID